MSCSHNNVSMTATHSNNVSINCKLIDMLNLRVHGKDVSQNQRTGTKGADRINSMYRICKENPVNPVKMGGLWRT